jgi:hypothetical protein
LVAKPPLPVYPEQQVLWTAVGRSLKGRKQKSSKTTFGHWDTGLALEALFQNVHEQRAKHPKLADLFVPQAQKSFQSLNLAALAREKAFATVLRP